LFFSRYPEYIGEQPERLPIRDGEVIPTGVSGRNKTSRCSKSRRVAENIIGDGYLRSLSGIVRRLFRHVTFFVNIFCAPDFLDASCGLQHVGGVLLFVILAICLLQR